MNKKIAIIICAAAAAVLIAFLLGRKSAAPAAQSSPSASAQTSETPSGSPSPSAASPEAARALTNDELQSFAKQLNSTDNYGFLLSEYSDVRDANLGQIFYVGAGITPAADAQSIANAYNAALGEDAPETDCTVLKTAQIDAFLKEKTGYSLKQMHSKLDWEYDQANDAYLFFHGDTNQLPSLSAAGKALGGDKYQLTCTFDGNFYDPDAGAVSGCIVTFTCKDGKFKFLSNSFVR